MIVTSKITERGGNATKAGGAGAKPCRGTASALTGGWIHRPNHDMATDQDSPASLAKGGLETMVVGSEGALSLAIGELIRDIPAFFPPEPICWDSSDYEIVELDALWVFQDFIIVRRNHKPSVPYFGAAWIEFRTIALSDFEGIDEFRRHAGLTGIDLEEQ